jgi:hypothetical protein
MIKAKISITIITCVLTLCSCSHSRNLTEEEMEKHMQEESRKETRDLIGGF